MMGPASGTGQAALETGTADRSSESAVRGELISVIIPIRERPEDLKDLYDEYAEALETLGQPFEFIFAAEPWRREYARGVASQVGGKGRIRVIEAAQTVGEAALLKLAAQKAAGEILVTSPAYFRVEAGSLVNMVRRVQAGTDLAVARRWPRRDSWLNRVQTRAFHWALAKIAGGSLHDVACNVTAMRREVLEELPLYGDFYRFLPVLGIREGYRVEEIACSQHPRDSRTRVYSPGIYLRRAIDLLNLFFLLRFTFKPLRFFGMLGSVLGLGGVVILATLLVQRLSAQPIANRPMLLLGVLLLTLGLQLFALGLVGEIIVYHQAPFRKSYRVADQGRRER